MTEGPEITNRPLWVFGYGSLMWHPGFPVAERQVATLAGYARTFCMSSIHHRGTVEEPGLVLEQEQVLVPDWGPEQDLAY